MKTEKIKAPFWAYLLSAALVLLLIGVLLLPSYLNTHMDGEIQNFAEMENAFRAVAEYLLVCGDAVYSLSDAGGTVSVCCGGRTLSDGGHQAALRTVYDAENYDGRQIDLATVEAGAVLFRSAPQPCALVYAPDGSVPPAVSARYKSVKRISDDFYAVSA